MPASELAFVWQVEDTSLQMYLVSDEERALAKTMATYWTNFARSSDPNVGPKSDLAIPWLPYSEDKGEHSLKFDLPTLTDLRGNQFESQCDFVNQLGVIVPPESSSLATPFA